MSTHVTLRISGFKGTQEDLQRLIGELPARVPEVMSARALADPRFKLPVAQTESSPEAIARADEWLKQQMDKHDFVPLENGGIKLGGRQGYFRDGPGLSATTVYNFFRQDPEIANISEQHPHHPLDLRDFLRCQHLFEAVPEWRSRMSELAELSRVWAKLNEHWDELELAARESRLGAFQNLLESCSGEA